jgi:hypothetical protein
VDFQVTSGAIKLEDGGISVQWVFYDLIFEMGKGIDRFIADVQARWPRITITRLVKNIDERHETIDERHGIRLSTFLDTVDEVQEFLRKRFPEFFSEW